MEAKAEAERRWVIEDEARTRKEMIEEALEGETTRREEAKARLGVASIDGNYPFSVTTASGVIFGYFA